MHERDYAAAAVSDLVPETAPFSPEQRAWLNGFFAGLISPDDSHGVTAAVARAQNAADHRQMATMAKRPGTIRRLRLPSA